jgi:hypothetical protein
MYLYNLKSSDKLTQRIERFSYFDVISKIITVRNKTDFKSNDEIIMKEEYHFDQFSKGITLSDETLLV